MTEPMQLSAVLPPVLTTCPFASFRSTWTSASTPPCQLGPSPARTATRVQRSPCAERRSRMRRAPSGVYSTSLRPGPRSVGPNSLDVDMETHWKLWVASGPAPMVRSSARVSPLLKARISSSKTRVAHAMRPFPSAASVGVADWEGFAELSIVDGLLTLAGEALQPTHRTRIATTTRGVTTPILPRQPCGSDASLRRWPYLGRVNDSDADWFTYPAGVYWRPRRFSVSRIIAG